VGNPRHRLEGHLHDLVGASSGGGGDEADTTGVMFATGIEGRSCDGCGVSSVEATGTGRVDPLPIGGHGAS
jgi:hypothetical protein